MKKKKILCLIGKSGSGKTTIANYLQENYKYNRIITCTTRPMREGEVDGKDYIFMSLFEFEQTMESDMTCVTNFRGWYYGVSETSIEICKNPVIILDPRGYMKLRENNKYELMPVMITVKEDRERFIRQLNRGDSILEVALREERDRPVFDILNDMGIPTVDTGTSVDEGVRTIQDTVTELFEVINSNY